MKLVKIQNEVKIISGLKAEEVKKLRSIKKNVQYDAKGTPIFGIDFSDTTGSINNKSIVFSETTEDGCAMLTVMYVPKDGASENQDLIRNFTEEYVDVIDKLTAFEPIAAGILDELNTRVNTIINNAETIHING